MWVAPLTVIYMIFVINMILYYGAFGARDKGAGEDKYNHSHSSDKTEPGIIKFAGHVAHDGERSD